MSICVWNHQSRTNIPVLSVCCHDTARSVHVPIYREESLSMNRQCWEGNVKEISIRNRGCCHAYWLGGTGWQKSYVMLTDKMYSLIWYFSTVHYSIELFNQPTLMHKVLCSLTICLLHYYLRHVSSINMSIFRRKNCIHTASSIFALCKRLPRTLVESVLNQCTVQTFTESEDTRCCVNTIFPPEDGHVNARNMSKIIV